MNMIRSMYCRTFQLVMRAGCYALPWRQPALLEGESALARLPEAALARGCKAILVVTDPQLMALGLPLPLLEGLEAAGIRTTVYSKVQQNPTIGNVEEALALYKENHCDSLLAFGGGSSMDCAKACGARVVRPRKSVSRMKGLFKILHRLPPFFAVPTTAGTGSETTVAAVITDSGTHHKYAINDISLVSHVAVLDPVLTAGLPGPITAATGLDALTHAVEAYIGRSNTGKTRRQAREAVSLIFGNLEEAWANGSNLTARANMLRASYLGGAAFTRAYVGYVHAIAHTLGGFYGIPHGLANAAILPRMLERFGPSVYKPLSELALAAGLSGATRMERAEAFIEAVYAMNLKMGIPRTFPQIRREDVPKMAEYADREANPLYPVPKLFDRGELQEIILSLMEPVPGDTAYAGYTGRIADIHLGTGEIKDYPVPDGDRRRYLGGKGLAARILYDNLPPATDPYGEENILVVTTGPLTGSGAPSSARFNISTISPLTGLCASTNSGGDFGIQLKKCGYDGLIIRGKSPEPVYLDIRPDGGIHLKNAAHLVGKNTGETGEILDKPHLAIGPAGENKVRYAAVMSGERACGRGGVGAVFGDKNLKAICAKGSGPIRPADPEGWKAFNKKWIAKIRRHVFTGGKCPELGTAMLVRPMQKHGLLPAKNFREGRFDAYDALSGETLRDKYLVKNGGCTACPIHCSRIVELDGKQIKGPELETLGLLGPNLLNGDLALIIRLNYILDQLGMDTMSTGATLSFAMHLADAGVVDLGLRFGKTDNLEETVRKIACREGEGDILAEGSRRMALRFGESAHAMQVKGQELAAYNPRNAFGQGLSYATANRGACHLNGGYLVLLEGLGLAVKGRSTASKAQLGAMFQCLMEAISASGICLFTSYAVFPSPVLKYKALNKVFSGALSLAGPAVRFALKHPRMLGINGLLVPYSKALALVTGMPMNLGLFLEAGKASYDLERRINLRQGMDSSEDTLPGALLEEVPLEKMMKKYYKAMEWDG